MAETYKQRIARENREHTEKVARAQEHDCGRGTCDGHATGDSPPPELPKETD